MTTEPQYLSAVLEMTGVTERDLLFGRDKTSTAARMLVFWLLCERLGMSYRGVGRLYEVGANTVKHSWRVIEVRRMTEPQFHAWIAYLIKRVEG